MNSVTRSVLIATKRQEALDICSFELTHPDGGPLPSFSAGAHIDVHLPNGQIRQYSLCNDPVESHRYLIAVLLDPASRGGSIAMHALAAGDRISISEPKNHFPLAHDAAHSILVAGGIGITPILCMAERLANIGASFELHYCTRSRNRTAFLERIGKSPFAHSVRMHHDDGPDSQKLNVSDTLATAGAGSHLYVCGPTGFMDWVLSTARAAGWAEQRLHREYFAAAPVDSNQDSSFEVKIASSGAVVKVAANQSVVAALAEHGIDIPTSCEQGVCGTCLTRILAGTPDHRDVFMTAEEQAKNDQFTPCCSRSKSNQLVLDL